MTEFKNKNMLKKQTTLLLLLLSSCTFTSTVSNDPNDLIAGKKYADTFYQKLMSKDVITLVNSAHDSLLIKFGKAGLTDQFNYVQSQIGNIKGFKVTEIKTDRKIDDKTTITHYALTNNVEYEKGNTIEALELIKDGNGKFKIKSYSVDLE